MAYFLAQYKALVLHLQAIWCILLSERLMSPATAAAAHRNPEAHSRLMTKSTTGTEEGGVTLSESVGTPDHEVKRGKTAVKVLVAERPAEVEVNERGFMLDLSQWT